ncbi:MAG: DMT family transporter [Chitinophagaceae bacterium]
MKAEDKLKNWVLFAGLSLIWGSSFILMKIGLNALTAYQVASLRILSAGVLLLPVAVKKARLATVDKLPVILISGLLGSFFPAFLFCIAETRINSALVGILNALTPVFTVLFGITFFSTLVGAKKILGVLIGFTGLCLLVLGKGVPELSYLSYAFLVVLATVCYGLNTNVVNRYLKNVKSLEIASLAFGMLILPSLLILFFTGFFSMDFSVRSLQISVFASCVLGAFGTAIASIMYYLLIKSSGTIFTSMVTYAIPIVAIGWGTLSNEPVIIWEVICLVIILAGVALTAKS